MSTERAAISEATFADAVELAGKHALLLTNPSDGCY